jgi:hypothetical protein
MRRSAIAGFLFERYVPPRRQSIPLMLYGMEPTEIARALLSGRRLPVPVNQMIFFGLVFGMEI